MKKIIFAILLSLLIFNSKCFAENLSNISENLENISKNEQKNIKDIEQEESDGIYTIKINTKLLKGEIQPHYCVHLQTNKSVFDETNARLVVNAGFFDAKNEQTVSYLTYNEKLILNPKINKNLMDNPHLKPYMDKILNRSEFRIYKNEKTDMGLLILLFQ